MKTRILAAAFLVPALFLLVLVLPKGFAAVVMGILQAIASYELLYRTRLVTNMCLFCCLAYRVIVTIVLNSIYKR